MNRKYYFEDDKVEKGMLFSFDLEEHDKQIRAEVIEKIGNYTCVMNEKEVVLMEDILKLKENK